jgi:hypothetical protein
MTATLRVEPFTHARVPALRAFNQRLAAGGAGWRFPEDPEPDWLPRVSHSDVFQELFVVLEGEAVRGAYALKHQSVSLRGVIHQVGNLYMPLSEGTINRAYSLVGARLFSDALRRESLLFALGLGGNDAQVTGLVRALGWQLYQVPFFFKVINGPQFLRQIRYLRTTRGRTLLLDLAAISGIGSLAATAARALLTRPPRTKAPIRVQVVDRFDGWADEIWQRAAASYSFLAVRTSEVLNQLYPPERPELSRLRISIAGRVIGYAVIQDQTSAHSEFLGEMRVGTLLDVLALPEDAETVTWVASQALERRGVDLIISNQSHPAWRVGLGRAGFIEGPSKCLFAVAKQLDQEIRAVDPNAQELHLTRGDGDWPWGVDLRASVVEKTDNG